MVYADETEYRETAKFSRVLGRIISAISPRGGIDVRLKYSYLARREYTAGK
jgi:hypothetical protein